MKTLLNIIWLIFAGLGLWFAYVIAGILLCIPIITIPFAVASFRIAGYALWPFGRTVVDKPGAGAGSWIGNVLWIVLAGWWLAIGHIVTAVPLFISIIGIPLGVANIKLIPVSLLPLGKEIVPSDVAFPTYERGPRP
ncbi:YccF domain-containing protein [Antribacter gilvus]|uniref:YccF domain-containing protein n=1 Tax=Antribacter gilvus TaxID=2304675 RepID=UPI000F77FA5D|nr:YccF domain-containing protein [Antribacter gilvus]